MEGEGEREGEGGRERVREGGKMNRYIGGGTGRRKCMRVKD